MKDFQELLKENSLFGNAAEQEAFIKDDTNVAEAFVFNFLGILGLLNGAQDNSRIKRYLRADKKVRIDNIGVRNNDMSLSLKLVHDKGWFRTSATVNQITRFLAKLKTGKLDNVNSAIVQEWVKSMKTQKFLMALGARLRKIVMEFLEDENPDLHLLAANLKGYYRMYPETSGEFNGLARKTKLMTISERDQAQMEKEKAEREKMPPTREVAEFLKTTHDSARFGKPVVDYDATDWQKKYGDRALEAVQIANFIFTRARVKGPNDVPTDPQPSSHYNKTVFTKFITGVLDEFDADYLDAILIDNIVVAEDYTDVIVEMFAQSQTFKAWLAEKFRTIFEGDRYGVDRRIRSLKLLKSRLGIDVVRMGGASFIQRAASEIKDADSFSKIYKLGNEFELTKEEEFRKPIAEATTKLLEDVIATRDLTDIRTLMYQISGSNFSRIVAPDEASSRLFANKLHTAFVKAGRQEGVAALITDTWGEGGYYDFNANHLAKSIVKKFMVDAMDSPAKPHGTTSQYRSNISINPMLNYVDPEDAEKVVDKFIELAKKGNTEWRDDSWRRTGDSPEDQVEQGRYAEAMSVKIMQTMVNQHFIENHSSKEIMDRITYTFEKYLPDIGDKRKSELIHTAYNVISNFSKQNYRSQGGSESGRRAQMDLLIYNAQTTGLPLPLDPMEVLRNGGFDDVQPDQAEGLLTAMNEGKMQYLFSKEKIKSVYKREAKRRVKDFYFGLLFDNIEAHPDLVNDYYSKMDTYLQNDMRKHLVGAGALVSALQKGEIQPHTKVTHTRLKEMLSYNGVRVEEVLSGLGLRKKKNEPITEYIKRAKQMIDDSDGGLGKLLVDNEEWSEDQKRSKTVEIQDRYRNGKHGDIYLVIKNSFAVSLPEDDWIAFRRRMNQEGVDNQSVIPSFHGTGGVAATMILRYGFRVLKSGDASVVGRMLGDGIYFSNKIDKALQYCGNDGYGRQYGTRGYIFDMKSQLGQDGRDYRAAGLGRDHIRSPEWAVRDGRSQLKIVRAYEVELISPTTYNKIKSQVDAEQAGGTVTEGFLPLTFEQFNEEYVNNMNEERFTIYDGNVFLPNGNAVWFEDVDVTDFPTGVRIEHSGNGIVVVFEGVERPAMHDVRYCTSMKDNAKNRYFDLMEERVAADNARREATEDSETA